MLRYDKKLFLFLFFCAVYFIILLRTAWISDDAAITLRTVLNFINGYGPVFNVDERVQAYTHPLWFFLLTVVGLVSDNLFYGTFFFSIAVSLLVFGILLYGFTKNSYSLILVGLSLILSKSFVDFSTSGLENPLSHLLLVFAIVMASKSLEQGKDKAIFFFFICSCVYLSRPDLLLILFPLAVVLGGGLFSNLKSYGPRMLLAVSPVLIWTIFSLFYYGFPLPNTAYAKLGTGISIVDRFFQGGEYFLHSINRDPITPFIIFVGVLVGLFTSKLSRLLSIGVALYLFYIAYIGGDFMEGRFLTAPFVVSLVLISREVVGVFYLTSLIVLVLILGSVNINSNIIDGEFYVNSEIYKNGIADERGFYYQRYGLLTASEKDFLSPEWEVTKKDVQTICGFLGFRSIMEGPGMHYIDDCALADPLLSRLPAKENPNWRVGHYLRQLPTNYIESIQDDENLLSDDKTKNYYDFIRSVTRGPLFDLDRLINIAILNFNLVEKPDWNVYRVKDVQRNSSVPMVSESYFAFDGGHNLNERKVAFAEKIDVALIQPRRLRGIRVFISGGNDYEILALVNEGWLKFGNIELLEHKGSLIQTIVIEDPKLISQDIRILRFIARYKDSNNFISELVVN